MYLNPTTEDILKLARISGYQRNEIYIPENLKNKPTIIKMLNSIYADFNKDNLTLI